MKVTDVLRRAYRIANDDPDNPYRWTEDFLLEELNDIILEIGQELGLFKQDYDITIFNGQAEYDYDEDITEIMQIRSEGYQGRVVLPSSLQQLQETGRVPTSDTLNALGTGLTLAFHNSSSYGKLKLDPIPRAEESGTQSHVWTE
jgi:hypothetical protein